MRQRVRAGGIGRSGPGIIEHVIERLTDTKHVTDLSDTKHLTDGEHVDDGGGRAPAVAVQQPRGGAAVAGSR